MPISAVVFADISSFTVGATEVEGIQGAQLNEPAEIRPIYTWGSAYPRVLISVPVLGSGSFSYVASDGGGSSLDQDWRALLDGTVSVSMSGGLTSGNSFISEGQQSVTLTGCVYQGKSFGMNARNEGIVTVNFAFKEGLNG